MENRISHGQSGLDGQWWRNILDQNKMTIFTVAFVLCPRSISYHVFNHWSWVLDTGNYLRRRLKNILDQQLEWPCGKSNQKYFIFNVHCPVIRREASLKQQIGFQNIYFFPSINLVPRFNLLNNFGENQKQFIICYTIPVTWASRIQRVGPDLWSNDLML